MPWVRFDDGYPRHPKIAPLSDRRYRLANEAIFWSAGNLTDGIIRPENLDQVSHIRPRPKPADAAELVTRRIWHAAGDPPCTSEKCPPPGPDGWVIHDYWDFQPSKADVLAERKAKADRQKRWRDSRRGGSASRNGSHNASTPDRVDGPGDASVTPAPYPPPPRPAPKEAGGGAPRAAQPERLPPASALRGAAGSPQDPTPRRPADPDTVRSKAAEARAALRGGRVGFTPTPAGDAFRRLMAASSEPPKQEDQPHDQEEHAA